MTTLPQPSRSRDRISRFLKFGFALALAGLFMVAAPQSAQAGISKWLCSGIPPTNVTSICQVGDPNNISTTTAGTIVYYVVRYQNLTGSTNVALNDTYPPGFVGTTVNCTDDDNGNSPVYNGPATSIFSFILPINHYVTCTIEGVFSVPYGNTTLTNSVTGSGLTNPAESNSTVTNNGPLGADL